MLRPSGGHGEVVAVFRLEGGLLGRVVEQVGAIDVAGRIGVVGQAPDIALVLRGERRQRRRDVVELRLLVGEIVRHRQDEAVLGELRLFGRLQCDDVIGAGLADHLDDLLVVELRIVDVDDIDLHAVLRLEAGHQLGHRVGVEAGDGRPGDRHAVGVIARLCRGDPDGGNECGRRDRPGNQYLLHSQILPFHRPARPRPVRMPQIRDASCGVVSASSAPASRSRKAAVSRSTGIPSRSRSASMVHSLSPGAIVSGPAPRTAPR